MSTDIRRLLHKSYGDELSITMNGSDIKYVQVAQFATDRFGMNVHINLKHRDQRPILNAQFSVKDNQKKFEVVGVYNNPLVLEDKDNGKVEIAVIGNGVYLKLDNNNINNKISLDAIMEVKRDITYGILINENVIIYDGQVNPDVFHASTINLAADIEKNTDTLNVHTIYNKKKNDKGEIYTDLIYATDTINTKKLNNTDELNTKDLNWANVMDGKKIKAQEIVVSKTTSEGSLNTGTLDVVGNTTVSETMNATTVNSLDVNISNKLTSGNNTVTKDLDVSNKLTVNNDTVISGNAILNNVSIGQSGNNRLVITPKGPVKLDNMLLNGANIKSITNSKILVIGEEENIPEGIAKHTTEIHGDLVVKGELTYSDDNRSTLISVDVKDNQTKSGFFIGNYRDVDIVTEDDIEHYFYIRRPFENQIAQHPVLVSDINSTFNDQVTLNDNLIVNGSTTLNEHLNINNGVFTLKNDDITEFEIGYDDTLKDTRTYARKLFADEVGISSGGLSVTGDTNIKNKLIVSDGRTEINDELVVNDDLDITGNLHVDGNLTIGGSINVLTQDELHIRDKTIVINKPNVDTDSIDNGHGAGLVIMNNGNNVDLSFKYNAQETGVPGRFTSSVPLNTNQYLLDKTSVIEKKDGVFGLGSNVLTSKLTSVGTINSGVWNGTSVGAKYGGTGQIGYAKGDILYSNSEDNLTRLSIGGAGRFLQSVKGVPEWKDITAGNGIKFIDNEIGHTNLVTGGAKTYGDLYNKSSKIITTDTGTGTIEDYGFSVDVPRITHDEYGHITSASVMKVKLPTPGNAKISLTGDTNISINDRSNGNTDSFKVDQTIDKLFTVKLISDPIISELRSDATTTYMTSSSKVNKIYGNSTTIEGTTNITTLKASSSIESSGTLKVAGKSTLDTVKVTGHSTLDTVGLKSLTATDSILTTGSMSGDKGTFGSLDVTGSTILESVTSGAITATDHIETSKDFKGMHIELSGNVKFTSDKRLKNINMEIPSTLEGLMKTKLYDYNYTYSGERNIGVLAQDIEENFKEFDTTLVDTIKGDHFDDQKQLKETKLVYILWKALQEEVEERKKLEKRISELEKK